MKTFAVEFKGYYPVGTCAIVTAVSRLKAIKAVLEALEQQGLPQTTDHLTITEIDTNKPSVTIVIDGTY